MIHGEGISADSRNTAVAAKARIHQKQAEEVAEHIQLGETLPTWSFQERNILRHHYVAKATTREYVAHLQEHGRV